MGYYCTVPQCTSLAGKTKNVKFHRFPRDVNMADKWNVILKRGKPYTKYSKVCSLHFTQADYNVTTMGQWKTLSKDAVPSQNLPKLNPDGTVMVIRKSRTVKYRDGKKEEICDKVDKWQMPLAGPVPAGGEAPAAHDQHDTVLYRHTLHTLSTIASTIAPPTIPQTIKPKKQDAIMQTDPVQNDDDDTQPNNSYSEVSDKSYNSEIDQYGYTKDNYSKDNYAKDNYTKDNYQKDHYQKESTSYKDNSSYSKDDYNKDSSSYTKDNSSYSKDNYTKDNYTKDNYSKVNEPKDYTKTSEDYIPQTNEEYNKEAERYALERKSHGYDMKEYQKQIESNYQKMAELYPYDKNYPREGYYQNSYSDSAELLRNQQQNLQILQEHHRLNENQNFFNENDIKQEIDINVDDYERAKEQMDGNPLYDRRIAQRLIDHMPPQVKQEPETNTGVDTAMQPQGSPYYPTSVHNNIPGQNTMKRPFFYSENPHYNGPQLLHRYEDISRILQ